MNWLLITIIAYFLNSLAMVIDKKLLSKTIPDALTYTFYVGILGSFFIPILPLFGVNILPFFILFLAFLAGGFFILALLLMYRALTKDEVSRITPFIGGLVPLFILFLAFLFLGENLNQKGILAFLLILGGGFLISLNFNQIQVFPFQSLGLVTSSSFFFAASYALTKYIYNHTDFISGFFWIRIGAILTTLTLLTIPTNWQKIKQNLKKQKQNFSPLLLLGQTLGGGSALLLSFAIFLGSVTLVNSLQGLQYCFLFFLVYFFSKFYPRFLKENFTPTVVVQKVLAITLMSIGLFILSVNL